MLLAIARSAPTHISRRAASSAIALKYSNAVYSAALAKSPPVLTKVQTELNAIYNAIKDIPELKTFIHNPTLSGKDRSAGLVKLFSRIEGSGPKKETVSDLTKNLFAILSENGRLGETTGVIEGFNELVARHKGELKVVVSSASPLPKDVLIRLEAALKMSQAGQQSKSLKVTNKVPSPSLRRQSCPHIYIRRSTPRSWVESLLMWETKPLI